MTVLSRPVVKALVTVAALAALAAPAVVAFAAGWLDVGYTSWDEQPEPDPTSPEAWVAFALFYLAWSALVLAGLVAVFDRLGYKYMPVERATRPSRGRRRRRSAGLQYLESRDAPPTREKGD